MKKCWPFALLLVLVIGPWASLLFRGWFTLTALGTLGVLMTFASLWALLASKGWWLASLPGVAGTAMIYAACVTVYWRATQQGFVSITVHVRDSIELPLQHAVCEITDIDSGTSVCTQETDCHGTCVVTGDMLTLRQISVLRALDVLCPNRYALTIRDCHGNILLAKTISPTLSSSLSGTMGVVVPSREEESHD